jgi:hypothetical protein
VIVTPRDEPPIALTIFSGTNPCGRTRLRSIEATRGVWRWPLARGQCRLAVTAPRQFAGDEKLGVPTASTLFQSVPIYGRSVGSAHIGISRGLPVHGRSRPAIRGRSATPKSAGNRASAAWSGRHAAFRGGRLCPRVRSKNNFRSGFAACQTKFLMFCLNSARVAGIVQAGAKTLTIATRRYEV